jgi:intracellular septation protein
MALGLVQIGTRFVRRKPIGAVGWLSLVLLIAAGTTTLLTKDPRFMLFKPSVLYAIAGVVMLKPGWMHRYMPAIAKVLVPDIAVVYGFVWAGLMFISAAVNAFVALTCSITTWLSRCLFLVW